MENPVAQRPADPASSMENSRQFDELCYQSDAADFISQDSDLQIFRRFDKLRFFVILRHQHRLAAMANQLETLKIKAHKDPVDEDIWKDGTLDKFTKDVESALKDYDAAILAQTRINRLRSPTSDFVHKFICFCASNIQKLNSDIGVFSSKEKIPDSLAAIAAKEKSWTHRFIDQHDFLRERLAKTVVDNDGWHIMTYSESNIRRAELIFMNVTFSLMLLCPIIALSFIKSAAGKLAIVLGFLLLGAILTSGIVTRANNTGLGVLAGYGAILVFFLGTNINIS